MKKKAIAKKVTIDGITFDSKMEKDYYFGTLRRLEKAGKIKDLKVLNNKKDFTMLYKPVFVLKNNKRFKTGKVAYTADFSFFNINSNEFPYLPDGINCILEYKSGFTEKKTAYRMRKSIFISKLKVNQAFIEVVEYSGKEKRTRLANRKSATRVIVYLKGE